MRTSPRSTTLLALCAATAATLAAQDAAVRPTARGAADPPPTRGAANPRPACGAPEARQFDFWIGEWDVLNRQRAPGPPDDTTLYDTGGAVDRVHAMLDGCLIVEHWEGHLLPDRHVIGFSARAWDPETRRWVTLLNWPGPRGAVFFLIRGRFEDGVASFVFEPAAGGFVRYRFRDVARDRLTWEGARSEDGDRWEPFWIMRFRRRNPVTDPALLHEPAVRITERCADPRARAFDFLVGEWEGEEVLEATGARRPVRIEAWPLLEGCAVMDVATTGEGEGLERRWRVRSFLAGEERWVQYSVDRGDPVFVRWEGPESGEERVLVRAGPEDGSGLRTRVRWSRISGDGYVRETATSSDAGETWTTVGRATLRRR